MLLVYFFNPLKDLSTSLNIISQLKNCVFEIWLKCTAEYIDKNLW